MLNALRVLILSLLFVGCTKRDIDYQTLTITYSADIRGFDPAFITDLRTGEVVSLLYDNLVRGQVLQLKHMEYVQSVKALGFSKLTILLIHILPNSLAPIIVTFTPRIAGAIMAEASLSFLGLGAQPPTPSWGVMINSSKDFLRIVPGASMAQGTTTAMAVLGFNLLGDSIRDLLDPTMKKG